MKTISLVYFEAYSLMGGVVTAVLVAQSGIGATNGVAGAAGTAGQNGYNSLGTQNSASLQGNQPR